MARIAGSSHAYTFRVSNEYGFDLPSVTHIIKSVGDSIGGAGAMAWWGFKLGIRSQHPLFSDTKVDEQYEKAKQTEWTPNKQRDTAGSRGTEAHDLLELLATGEAEVHKDVEKVYLTWPKNKKAPFEEVEGYKLSAAQWWLDNLEGWNTVFAERPVWSLSQGFAGTLDLARYWGVIKEEGTNMVEVVDYKTHKPAAQDGPSYVGDRIQLAAYSLAVEEMGLGLVGGTRVVLLGPDGTYLEDTRRVDAGVFLAMKEIHDATCEKCS
jgi:hypothetical protein